MLFKNLDILGVIYGKRLIKKHEWNKSGNNKIIFQIVIEFICKQSRFRLIMTKVSRILGLCFSLFEGLCFILFLVSFTPIQIVILCWLYQPRSQSDYQFRFGVFRGLRWCQQTSQVNDYHHDSFHWHPWQLISNGTSKVAAVAWDQVQIGGFRLW